MVVVSQVNTLYYFTVCPCVCVMYSLRRIANSTGEAMSSVVFRYPLDRWPSDIRHAGIPNNKFPFYHLIFAKCFLQKIHGLYERSFVKNVFLNFSDGSSLIFKRFVTGPLLGDVFSPWSARPLLYILEFI